MKTRQDLLMVAIVAVIFSAISCRERVELNETGKGISVSESAETIQSATLFDNIQQMTPDSIRYTLRVLTPQERYSVWKAKLLHAKGLAESSGQDSLISLILNELSEDVFDWKSDANVQFKNTFLAGIKDELSRCFQDQEGINTFYHLYRIDYLGDSTFYIPDVGMEVEDCDCDRNSFFGACQFLGDFCENDPCDKLSYGCGFIGIWNCNGMCDDTPVPNYDDQLFAESIIITKSK